MKPIVNVYSFLFFTHVNCLIKESSILIANLTRSNSEGSLQNQIFPVMPEDLNFILYTRANPNGYRLYRNIRNLKNSSFNSSYPTKVIIHGYVNNYISAAIQLPKNAYLSTGEYNVLAVDWSEYSFPYIMVANSARAIGHMTASLISFLKNYGGLRLSDLHIIGHSLGAHIAGFVVEVIGKPARITGLDPAAPIFSDQPPSERLGAEDAEFVDVIHTSVGVLGMLQNIGHADFYPAGGKHQPKCPKEDLIGFCDHGQSYIYFTESIRNRNKFPAVKCKSLSDALGHRCNGRKTALMGDSAIYRKPRGIYYVDVSSFRRPKTFSDYFKVFKEKNSLLDYRIF